MPLTVFTMLGTISLYGGEAGCAGLQGDGNAALGPALASPSPQPGGCGGGTDFPLLGLHLTPADSQEVEVRQVSSTL